MSIYVKTLCNILPCKFDDKCSETFRYNMSKYSPRELAYHISALHKQQWQTDVYYRTLGSALIVEFREWNIE